MVAFNIDPRQYVPEVGGSFTLWPNGWHKVAVDKAEWKSTAANDGSMYLQLDLVGVDPADPMHGKTLAVRLNLGNKSPEAVQRAGNEAAAIAYVCGFQQQVPDTDQLRNIPFFVETEITKSKGRDGKELENNNVKAYRNVNGVEPMDLAKAAGGKVSGQAGAGSAPAPAAAPAFAPGPAQAAPGPGPAPGAPAFAPGQAQPAPGPGASPFPPQGTAPAAPAAAQAPAWQPGAAPAPGGAPAAPWGNR